MKKLGTFKRADPLLIGQQIWDILAYHVPRDVMRCAQIQLGWPLVVGKPWCDHAWPHLLQGETLIIHVRDHQWMHEAAYAQAKWLPSLRQAFPTIPLHNLNLRVGDLALPQDAPEPRAAEPTHFWVTLPSEPDASAQAALREVQDGNLRLLLATLRLALSQR